MVDEILKILNFVLEAFLQIWPYLVVTIPIAVAVNMSGASKQIKRVFQAGPFIAILLATAAGAFSPFCSCGVIPVIAALLIGGVPLAPVMSFWIASPSMDPEIFFLSVGTIGWNLAVWRLVATLLLSLSAGFITHFAVQKKWIGSQILRNKNTSVTQSTYALLWNAGHRLKQRLQDAPIFSPTQQIHPPLAACCSGTQTVLTDIRPSACASPVNTLVDQSADKSKMESCGCSPETNRFWERLFKESYGATLMVVKFMALAFFLEAVIILYIPSEWIVGLLGQENPLAIIMAALLGVPTYTSNLSALPMVSGLLEQGMNPAAALAFLIAGPTTTLPAMAAVWFLVTRKVFSLYVSFSLLGAIIIGYFYRLAEGVF